MSGEANSPSHSRNASGARVGPAQADFVQRKSGANRDALRGAGELPQFLDCVQIDQVRPPAPKQVGLDVEIGRSRHERRAGIVA
jgi:hypothetical protein